MTDKGDGRFEQWASETLGIENAVLDRQLAGGNANVTYLVKAGEDRFVLRHPPRDAVSDRASAGIRREYRFVSALSGMARVPEAIGWCEDPSIVGAPFALFRFVPGIAITDRLPSAYPDTDATIDAIGAELAAGIAQVHAIDPAGLDLGDAVLARGFVARQVERWLAVRAADRVRDLPELEELGQWLLGQMPEPDAIRIVHCDYHLDNTLMDPGKPRLNAILDWEMATLADPLVDLGLLTALWNRDESTQPGFRFVQRVSNRPGAVGAEGLAERWSRVTGLSVRNLPYYQVFALWRLAAIVEGAYVLFRKGQVDRPYERGLEHDVPRLLRQAARVAGQERAD